MKQPKIIDVGLLNDSALSSIHVALSELPNHQMTAAECDASEIIDAELNLRYTARNDLNREVLGKIVKVLSSTSIGAFDALDAINTLVINAGLMDGEPA